MEIYLTIAQAAIFQALIERIKFQQKAVLVKTDFLIQALWFALSAIILGLIKIKFYYYL